VNDIKIKNLKGAHHFKDLVEDANSSAVRPLEDDIVKAAGERQYVYPQDQLKSLRAKFGFSDVKTPLVRNATVITDTDRMRQYLEGSNNQWVLVKEKP
jgi:hypothetical protein